MKRDHTNQEPAVLRVPTRGKQGQGPVNPLLTPCIGPVGALLSYSQVTPHPFSFQNLLHKKTPQILDLQGFLFIIGFMP